MVGPLAGGEGGVGDFGDLRIGAPPLLGLLPDRFGLLDRHPLLLGDAGDRGDHRGVRTCGDGKCALPRRNRGDHVVLLESTVGAHRHQATGSGFAGGGQCLCDHLARTAWGLHRALAQPYPGYRRCRGGGGERGHQRVEALDAAVPISRAFLGITVGLAMVSSRST